MKTTAAPAENIAATVATISIILLLLIVSKKYYLK
jgi:hypothetical protein